MTLEKQIIMFLMLVVLGGCSLTGKAPRAVKRYSVDYQLSDKEASQQKRAWVVQVRTFSVHPDYNSTKMIYRNKPGVSQEYLYGRWRANPGEEIAAMLMRDLRQSGLFTAVNGPMSRFAATHTLEGCVEEFYEDSETENWQARVRVNITLVANNELDITKRYVAQKDFFAQAKIDEHGPQGFALAMSQAVADLSGQILLFFRQL